MIGQTLEIGRSVRFCVEVALKLEQEPALTLLQHMAVQIVLEKGMKLELATKMSVQV